MKILYFILTLVGVVGMACGFIIDSIHLTVIAGVLTLEGMILEKGK